MVNQWLADSTAVNRHLAFFSFILRKLHPSFSNISCLKYCWQIVLVWPWLWILKFKFLDIKSPSLRRPKQRSSKGHHWYFQVKRDLDNITQNKHFFMLSGVQWMHAYAFTVWLRNDISRDEPNRPRLLRA